jgi:hypothetical protein
MDEIVELQKKLLKLGSELAKSDTEVQKWHEWFLKQKNMYENVNLNVHVYKVSLKRYQKFLEPFLDVEGKALAADEDVVGFVICQSCGEKNQETYLHCIYCGSQLKEEVDSLDQGEEKEEVPELTKDLEIQELKYVEKVEDDIEEPRVPLKQVKMKKIESFEPPISEKQEKEFTPEAEEIEPPVLRKSFREMELEWREILSFSKITLIGLGLFVTFLIIVLFLQFNHVEGSNRISIGLFGIAFFVLLFGFVLDLLRARNFSWQENWSALGAIICYFGVIFNFVPLFLYVLLPNLEGNELGLFSVEIVGILLVIVGATARWSEYDTKIWNQITILGYSIRHYGYREFFRKLRGLIKDTILGIGDTIWKGITSLPSRVKKFGEMIINAISNFLTISLNLVIDAITKALKAIWENIHWIGLLSILGYIFGLNFTTDQFFINTELLIIILFFFFLGVIYFHSDRATKVIGGTRDFVLRGVINTYSMLSGAKIKVNESIFCSRCLRGVQKIEFEELKVVKESLTPPCPFCGFENWVAIE